MGKSSSSGSTTSSATLGWLDLLRTKHIDILTRTASDHAILFAPLACGMVARPFGSLMWLTHRIFTKWSGPGCPNQWRLPGLFRFSEEVDKFKRAIDKDYYFQMYYDDLPAWVFIGRVDRGAETDPCHLMTAASYHVLH
ncbi:hypothetical protein HPP92_005613 [Vanilla planifolia]|uniref:Uncharacterized protein n=1 Tax=Vanilla planifolia TaxID=51239 RepID=A0A835VBI7_VANPL|nr:hypothetical protein HPP92_005613 [Vanilla planifolia]